MCHPEEDLGGQGDSFCPVGVVGWLVGWLPLGLWGLHVLSRRSHLINDGRRNSSVVKI